jgi:hypothetical protein
LNTIEAPEEQAVGGIEIDVSVTSARVANTPASIWMRVTLALAGSRFCPL